MTRHKFDNRRVFRRGKNHKPAKHDQKRVDRVARILDHKVFRPVVMGSDQEQDANELKQRIAEMRK